MYPTWPKLDQVGELDDDELEPPVPPGLRTLDAALASMAECLRLDPDLLRAASEVSRPLGDLGLDREAVGKWVRGLAVREKDGLIEKLIVAQDVALIKAGWAETAAGWAPLDL